MKSLIIDSLKGGVVGIGICIAIVAGFAPVVLMMLWFKSLGCNDDDCALLGTGVFIVYISAIVYVANERGWL